MDLADRRKVLKRIVGHLGQQTVDLPTPAGHLAQENNFHYHFVYHLINLVGQSMKMFPFHLLEAYYCYLYE